jgi:hypothetical protein
MAKPVGLSHRPNVLFAASAERLAAAVRAAGGSDWVMATYLAGLSVECMLQALALHLVPTHDARHDLSAWLSKCPRSFRDTLLSKLDVSDGICWSRCGGTTCAINREQPSLVICGGLGSFAGSRAAAML